MKYISLAVTILFCVCFVKSVPFKNAKPRIVGGNDAKEGQFPFIVSIRAVMDDEHFCGGSIINKRWVLTAAHCVEEPAKWEIYITAGTNNWNTTSGERYNISSIYINKGFDWHKYSNDTAVVKVDRDFDFTNPLIKKVELIKDYVGADEEVTLMGWGISNVNISQPTPQLQTLEAKTISYEDCKKESTLRVHPSEICTFLKNGKGICTGDSGSPLVLKGTNKQIGVVSWSYGCAEAPDVFSRISSYYEWVYKHTDSWE